MLALFRKSFMVPYDDIFIYPTISAAKDVYKRQVSIWGSISAGSTPSRIFLMASKSRAASVAAVAVVVNIIFPPGIC